MPVPTHVARRLRDLLGEEAGDDFVTWMDDSSAVRADVAELRLQMARMEANLISHIERMRTDLLKWSFVFWVGAVAAIAALAGVLGN